MEEEAAPELVYTEFEDLTDENCQLSEVVDNLYSKDWTVVF